jgi:hypothetical protein
LVLNGACVLAMMPGTLRAGPEDTVVGPIVVLVDTPMDFKATGSFTSTDNAPATGLGFPELHVIDTIPPFRWQFWIKHTVGLGWDDAGFRQGADNVFTTLRGEHIIPPADDAHVGVNVLPPISSIAINIDYGAERRMGQTGSQAHDYHRDSYGFETVATAVQGPPHQIAGIAEKTTIVAAHRGTKTLSDKAVQEGLGALNSNVSFNAAQGSLSFVVGPIDVADSQGTLSGGVDPQYAGDPVLAGQMVISSLQFQGLAPDGRYRFGGGQVEIIDPAGNFTFLGTFDEFLIGDTSRVTPVDSYAFLDLGITDLANVSDGASLFLQNFIDRNILGNGVSAADWSRIVGIDLSFTTATSLAVATNGFTESASMDGDVFIFSNRIPEPESLSLLLVAGLTLAASARRKK